MKKHLTIFIGIILFNKRKKTAFGKNTQFYYYLRAFRAFAVKKDLLSAMDFLYKAPRIDV